VIRAQLSRRQCGPHLQLIDFTTEFADDFTIEGTKRKERLMRARFILLVFVALLTLRVNGSGQSAQLPPASEMKTVGLIGGTSWYSTVDYYRYINEAVNDAYGNNTNPPLIVYNMNQQRIRELQAKGQWDEIAALLTQATIRLRAGGAQAILFCANTPHKVYAQVSRKTDLPILHIGDATGAAIRSSGLKKVGLIGTRYTMEDRFMVDWLTEHYGVETLVPSSAPARQELNRIIE
jgi:aspartate racemase